MGEILIGKHDHLVKSGKKQNNPSLALTFLLMIYFYVFFSEKARIFSDFSVVPQLKKTVYYPYKYKAEECLFSSNTLEDDI